MTEVFGDLRIAVAFCALAAMGSTAFAQDRSGPDEWLRDMAEVVEKLDYVGTVVRHKNGYSETFTIVHKIVDGVVNEKLVYQEGNGLEIIRFGNEVHCVLPDKKSVLIEKWNNQSTLFSSLPGRDSQFGAQYHTAIVREERVAGRPAIVVAIRPHDEFRYGHRLWLDRETAFPLRSDLVDNDGELIEQIKFAEISVGQRISASSLQSSFDIQNFTWYTEPARRQAVEVDADWECVDLPVGFTLVSTKTTEFSADESPVIHMMYSDGLATISVFVGTKGARAIDRQSNVGASNSYSTERDGYPLTAIGEVPAATVQGVAQAMRQR